MEVYEKRVDVGGSITATYELHHLTDTHVDDVDHAKDLLDERIRHIADSPNALWIGGGDYASLIVPGDKRFGSGGHLKGEWAEHMSRLPDYYLDRCEETFGPIANKCAGLVAGNHEATIGKNYHRGMVAELASRLGDPSLYLGDRGWSALMFQSGTRRLALNVFSYHGWSGGRLKGRKMIQAERDLGAWDADVFLLGHDHQPVAHMWWTQRIRKTKRGWQTINTPRAHLNGGSWGYGQKPPSSDADKLEWKKAAKAPGQSWVEGKNYRPEAPDNPYLEIHLDYGHGAGAKAVSEYRPAGFDLEIRWRGNRHYLGEAA